LDKGIELNIRPPTGDIFRVEVLKTDTILSVKTKIHAVKPVFKIGEFRLIHNGFVLDKTKTVMSYGLKYDTTLHIEKTT
jgi:hypothetical protein